MKIESMDVIAELQKEMNKESDIAFEKAGCHDEESDKEYHIAMAKHGAYLKCLEFIKKAMDKSLLNNRN